MGSKDDPCAIAGERRIVIPSPRLQQRSGVGPVSIRNVDIHVDGSEAREGDGRRLLRTLRPGGDREKRQYRGERDDQTDRYWTSPHAGTVLDCHGQTRGLSCHSHHRNFQSSLTNSGKSCSQSASAYAKRVDDVGQVVLRVSQNECRVPVAGFTGVGNVGGRLGSGDLGLAPRQTNEPPVEVIQPRS